MNRNIFRIVALIMVLVVWGNGCANQKKLTRREEADLHYEAGLGYINQGNPQSAVEQLKIAHDKNKKNPQIMHALGLAYLQMGMPDTALEWILKVTSYLPEDPEIQNNLASVYIRLEQYDKGIFHSTKAIDNPDYRTPAAAYFNRGISRVRKGDADGGEADFKAAIRHEPMYDMPKIELARLMIRKNLFDEAIRMLSTAINVNANNPESYLLRGQALWHRGYISRAETDFRKILELKNVSPSLIDQAHDWLEKLR